MGELVLHVGQAKAASTSIQLALTAARPTLARHGISYPDTGRPHHTAEACWFMSNHGFPAAKTLLVFAAESRRLAASGSWEALVASVRTAQSTIISSEYFSNFGPSLAQAAVDSLTQGQRSHARVVIVARSASTLLPSLYAQTAIDFALPSFETWVRMHLSRMAAAVRQDGSPLGSGDPETLATNWSQTAPVRVVEFDPPIGEAFEDDLFDAMALAGVVSTPVLGQANRGLCAARLIAWQRCLKRTGRPDNPGRLGKKVPFQEFDDCLLPGAGGRFALTQQAAALVDTAFPRPSRDGQPIATAQRESARRDVALLVTSTTPITEVVGVDPEGLSAGVNICLQHLPFESVRA